MKTKFWCNVCALHLSTHFINVRKRRYFVTKQWYNVTPFKFKVKKGWDLL